MWGAGVLVGGEKKRFCNIKLCRVLGWLQEVLSERTRDEVKGVWVQDEDILISVSGKLVSELSNKELTSLVRGKAGTKVLITFKRGDELLEKEITRVKITKDNVSSHLFKDEELFYIKIDSLRKYDVSNQL